jgi:hypothetical protein
MRQALLCLVLALLAGSAKADLTLVQRVEGAGGPAGEVTVRIKGDMARIDATPQISTIVDGKTGELLTLMKDQKAVVRISADKMKAAADMINKFADKKMSAAPAQPKPTGRKEVINGYEAEEYTVETPLFKAAYWVAPRYPNGAAILRQLQAVKSDIWNSAKANVPDYRELRALPIKTIIDLGSSKMTTTLVSAKEDPLADSDFAVPSDFHEVNIPDLGGLLHQDKGEEGRTSSPHP